MECRIFEDDSVPGAIKSYGIVAAMDETLLRFCDIENRVSRAVEYLRDRSRFRNNNGCLLALASSFRETILTGESLRIISHWGIGRKEKIGGAETAALEYKLQWIRELSSLLEVDWGAEFMITDTHAAINGIPDVIMNSYISSSTAHIKSMRCTYSIMSDLLRRHGIGDITRYLSDCVGQDGISLWDGINSTQRSELIKMAKVHAPHENPTVAAMRYCFCNLIESAALQTEFKGRIFVTHLTPGMKFLGPNLPTVYAYVGPNKLRRRPWFQDEDPPRDNCT